MIKKFSVVAPISVSRNKVKISTFNGINTKVAEENMPIAYSPKSYNFNMDKGVLEQGFGMSKAYTNAGGSLTQIRKIGDVGTFVKMYHYTYHDGVTVPGEYLVGCDDTGMLYYGFVHRSTGVFAGLGNYGVIKCAVPCVYNGLDGLMFATDTGNYVIRMNLVQTLPLSSTFTAMCAHNDRVYAAFESNGTRLYFSDDFNPANWNISLLEGGYIDFTDDLGKIVSIVSFGGYIYVFREYGINKISAFNDQTEFKVSTLYISVGQICQNTVTVCGDRIIFEACDGVYSFDGASISRIMTGLDGLFAEDQSKSFAAFHSGKYYLACRLDMDSTLEDVNSVVVYDVWKNTFNVAHGVTLSFMLSLNTSYVSCVLAEATAPVSFFGQLDDSGAIDTTATYKLWKSPRTLLGTSDKKLLREVIIKCESDMTLTVNLDGNTYTFNAVSGLNKFKVCRQFTEIEITIASSRKNVRVTRAELVVDVAK